VNRDAVELNKILVENFIIMQKSLSNLAVKFDTLSENIAKLLLLFEGAARAFAEKESHTVESKKDKEFLEKINTLMEQNKTIAKGLTLMGDNIRDRVYEQKAEGKEEKEPEIKEIKKLPVI
jgi:hypothetical protein